MTASGSTGYTQGQGPETVSGLDVHTTWDAGGQGCGELLLGLRKRLRSMPGQVIRLVATDPGAQEDLPAYCRMTGNQLLRSEPPTFWIRAKAAA